MMKTTLHRQVRGSEGFSLVELMAVMGVIALLVGLLFPAITKAVESARNGASLTEVRNIESSLRQYYTTYDHWPNTMPFIPNPEDNPVPLEGDLAQMLQGDDDANGNNPRRTRFTVFKRFDLNGDPMNIWGNKSMQTAPPECRYYVKFDTDYDNKINGTGDPKDPPEKDILAPVIVWTFGKKNNVLGSWM